jgi:hypothetical protein
MSYTLIVDQPARATQLRKAVGPDVTIVCTHGPLYTLPRFRVGIDVADSFKPLLEPKEGSANLIREITQLQNQHLFIVTDKSDEGYWLAQQVYGLLQLKPGTRSHVPLECTEIALLRQLPALAQPLNIPVCQAGDARRCLTRLTTYMLTEHLQRRIKAKDLLLESPMMDYYAAIFLTHLSQLSQNLKPRVGMELHYENGFQAHLVQAMPKDLARPKFVRTHNTKDLRGIAEQLAARRSQPKEGSRDIQIFNLRVQPFTTLSSLSQTALEQGDSLFELMSNLDDNFSAGNMNSIWGEGGQSSRKLLFHTLEEHFAEEDLQLKWLNPGVTIPKTALTWWNWSQEPEDTCLQTIKHRTLRASLHSSSYPVTYRILKCGDLHFWGKEVSPVGKGKTHPDARVFPDESFCHEFGGGDFAIHLNVHDSLNIGSILEPFCRTASFPSILRAIHHLIHSFQYCEVKGNKLVLTDTGQAVAASLSPFLEHLTLETHQGLEQDLLSIRRGQRDRTHFLHRWYNYLRGTYDEVQRHS